MSACVCVGLFASGQGGEKTVDEIRHVEVTTNLGALFIKVAIDKYLRPSKQLSIDFCRLSRLRHQRLSPTEMPHTHQVAFVWLFIYFYFHLVVSFTFKSSSRRSMQKLASNAASGFVEAKRIPWSLELNGLQLSMSRLGLVITRSFKC